MRFAGAARWLAMSNSVKSKLWCGLALAVFMAFSIADKKGIGPQLQVVSGLNTFN